jgi:hypothetical protein
VYITYSERYKKLNNLVFCLQTSKKDYKTVEFNINIIAIVALGLEIKKLLQKYCEVWYLPELKLGKWFSKDKGKQNKTQRFHIIIYVLKISLESFDVLIFHL